MEMGFFTERHINAWTADKVAKGTPIEYRALSASNSSSKAYPSDYWMENTSYIRLKNAEIGYSLPLKWSGKISAKRIRFYANGFNLITWDKMKNKGYEIRPAGKQRLRPAGKQRQKCCGHFIIGI